MVSSRLADIVSLDVLTSAETVDVGADGLSCIKVPLELARSGRSGSSRLNSIGDKSPTLVRDDNGQLKTGSDAWLVKAREPSVAEEGLQVSVDVDLAVLRVLVEVQTSRVDDVRVLKIEGNGI